MKPRTSYRRRLFICLIVTLFIALLLAAPLFLRRYLLKHKAINTALWSLTRSFTERHNATSELATFGEEAYPHMARAFRARPTLFDRAYDLAGRRLPSAYAAYFPARPSRDELRKAIARNLYDLGPAASRALLDEIGRGLEEFDDYEGMMLLRALYWSIPESPRAVQIFSNYLAHPKPGKLLFGMADAREIWPKVPHLAPLLPPWVELFDSTREAAEGLGFMETNAAFAVPMLIDLARTGLVVDTRFHSRYYGGNARQLQPRLPLANRAAAIIALGRIGIVTPETVAVLKSAYVDSSELIRRDAALAFAIWGSKAAPAVEYLTAHLDRNHPTVLQYQLYALSEIGAAAAPAIPLLLELSFRPQFSILEDLGRGPTSAPAGSSGAGPILWQNEPQPGMIAAALALTQVDLSAAPERLNVLALALHSIVPTQVPFLLRPFKDQLVPALEPDLQLAQPLGPLRGPFGPLGPPIRRILLASHILALDPANQPAQRLLQSAMSDDDPIMRSLAAKWLYRATGDIAKLFPVIDESLNFVKNSDDQTIIQIAGELGAHAKPLIPRIRSFLTHPDQTIRHAAGKALRSIEY